MSVRRRQKAIYLLAALAMVSIATGCRETAELVGRISRVGVAMNFAEIPWRTTSNRRRRSIKSWPWTSASVVEEGRDDTLC